MSDDATRLSQFVHAGLARRMAAEATETAAREGGTALERITAIRSLTGPNPINDRALALTATGQVGIDEIDAELERLNRFDTLTQPQRQHYASLVDERAKLEQLAWETKRNRDIAHMRSIMAGRAPGAFERGTSVNTVDGYDRDSVKDSGGRTPDLWVRGGDNPWDPNCQPTGGPQQRLRESRDIAMRALDSKRNRTADEGKQRIVETLESTRGMALDQFARWVRASSDPDYLSAFTKIFNEPDWGHRDFSEAEYAAWMRVRSETRALSLTDSQSGYLIPQQLDPAVIITNASAVNPIRQLARRVLATGDVWNGVSSEGVSIGFAAQATEVGDNSPTFSQPSISIHKAHGFVPISIEAIEDAENVAQEVARLFADAVYNLEATKFVTGTGSGEPFGVIAALNGTASEVAPTTAEQFNAADVFKTQQALAPRWRANATWAANLAVLHRIRQFETAGGVPMFPELQARRELLDRPIFEVSEMDGNFDPAATADNFLLVIGDWQQYVIADRAGSYIEPIPHLFGSSHRPTGQRGWYLWLRQGADVVVDSAFAVFNLATTA